MAYVVATDVGGTCTDTVVIGSGDEIVIGKALSTPPNFDKRDDDGRHLVAKPKEFIARHYRKTSPPFGLKHWP